MQLSLPYLVKIRNTINTLKNILNHDDWQSFANKLFHISNPMEFDEIALKLYELQTANNQVFQNFSGYFKRAHKSKSYPSNISYLPIDFFKSHRIGIPSKKETIFESSGSTQSVRSKHYMPHTSLYKTTAIKHFEMRYGPLKDFVCFFLLPSYHTVKNSSLITMCQWLHERSEHSFGGFYLDQMDKLEEDIQLCISKGKKCFLLGVTYALLDFAAQLTEPIRDLLVFETGGMKGRQKEQVRSEVHQQLRQAFPSFTIQSEYGMTELSSQAYTNKDGHFAFPAWAKAFVRDVTDPLNVMATGTGALNVIDLSNLYSCAFIATDDVVRIHADGSFEVLGRLDHSDVRGCSLLY